MKSAVMIAYGFPPEGHAGVYRPLRFVRNLASHGWKPIVVAAGGAPLQRPDQELLAQVPADVEVLRPVDPGDWWLRLQRWRGQQSVAAPQSVSGPQPQPKASSQPVASATRESRIRPVLREAVRRAESWWYHPDFEQHWIGPATDATVDACTRSNARVIWVTGPPWSAFLVAEKASRATGVPYVLDFRTSWTIVPSPFEERRPAWAQARDRKALRRLFAGAHAVVFFYAAEAECFWRMYRGVLDVSRIHVIPNGFDGDVEAFTAPAGDTFTLLYTGILSDYRYDTLLEGLTLFKRNNPTQWRRLTVKFVGEQEEEFVRRVAQLELSDVVSMHRPVPHAKVAGLQREAHALLMLERRPSHKGVELLAGAKLFNYLKAARPILGVVPSAGEAARILRDVGVSTIADAGSATAACDMLQTLFDGWQAGRLSSFVPDPAACDRYSSREQTAALVRALEGEPSLQPFVPGAIDIVPSLKPDFVAAGWA